MANVAALRDEAPGFDDSVSFEWEGATVVVKPIRKWKESARRAITPAGNYNFSLWAETSLDEDSYAHFLDVDPDMDQVAELFNAWNEIVHVDPKAPGSSSRQPSSRTSSRSTARR